jgi:hypothetical protein
MITTGIERIPETIALFRSLSQKRPWISGKIAMHSKRRAKKDTVQNGNMCPKFSVAPIVMRRRASPGVYSSHKNIISAGVIQEVFTLYGLPSKSDWA